MREPRPSSQSGIAIGAILFALALIAIIAVAMGAGGDFAGSLITVDRVKMEVKGQSALILAKIKECYNHGLTAKQAYCDPNIEVSPGVYSRSGCNPIDTTAFYPTSAAEGTAVESLDCPSYGTGAKNLWTGQSQAQLPPKPPGFDSWVYVNANDSGGRCIRIQPQAGSVNDSAVKQGLIEAANAYSTQELVFNSASSDQRYILWVTRPTGTPSAQCSSN